MSDHEGFEMLDETFGVREASDASDADSPHQQRNSQMWSRLQPPHAQSSSTPAGSPNDHVHHLGRVGMETGDEPPQEQVTNTPSESMRAISPRQQAKGCEAGTVPEKGAVLKIPGAGWDRFRLTTPATEEHREGSRTLAESSPPKDPRPRSVKTKTDGGDRGGKNNSTTTSTSSTTTAGARLCSPGDQQKEAAGKRAAFLTGDFSFDADAVVPTSEPRGGGTASDRLLLPCTKSSSKTLVPPTQLANRKHLRAAADMKREEAVNDAVDRLLVVAPAVQFQQPVSLGRGTGESVARARGMSGLAAALPPPPSEGGHGSTRMNAEDRSAEVFLSARTGEKGFPLAPAPLAATAAPSGAFPTASTATNSNTGLSPLCPLHRTPPAVALEAPFNPRAVAPLPPTPSRAAGLEQRPQKQPCVALAAAADPFRTSSRFGPLPPPTAPVLGFDDENRKPDCFGSASSAAAAASPSAWAEDEEATVELVGMGFDREHVVRALKECGRGESWKEAAISLLLEPQLSTMSRRFEAPLEADDDPTSGLSGGEHHGAAEQR